MARSDALGQILDQLSDGTLNDETIHQMREWQDSFGIRVEDTSLGDALLSRVTPAGASLLASIVVSGEGAVATLTTGATLSVAAMFVMFTSAAWDAVENVGAWTQIDANTAFYQWILDQVETGSPPAIDDNLLNFVDAYRAHLGELVGESPPDTGDRLAAESYLERHATAFLLFFGRFEEVQGADRFPRFKLNDPRYEVGYYRTALAAALTRELTQIQDEIIRAVLTISPSNCVPALSVEIPTTAAWTETGFQTMAGETIQIQADGQFRFTVAEAPMVSGITTPNGEPPYVLSPELNDQSSYDFVANTPYPDLPPLSLIGRISHGEAFYVGQALVIQSDADGQLYLGINDRDLADNEGVLTAQIMSVEAARSNTWTTDFGLLFLSPQSGPIRAPFRHQRGVIVGWYDEANSQIRGRWIQDLSDERCSSTLEGSPYWGNVTLNLSDDMTSFSARWGYCNEARDHEWTGHMVR